MAFLAWLTLNFPKSLKLKSVCLFKFEISTLSKSTIPILPTPDAAKYVSNGQPNPPSPTIKTFAEKIFFCPATPIFLNCCFSNL